ncbi:MAG: argininosuccinate synthase [Bacteroidetes bacterium]|nr:MAG: argininosuccinate synthase [Bacteroidota bacterium]
MTTNKKIVLAFSGGLDTSFCAVWLREQGYEVHALTINTGGFNAAELGEIKKHAEQLGVSGWSCIDGLKQYYEKCIRFLIFGNVLKNNTYPLSVSAERITQAMLIADFVKQCGADCVAHGSTGAGNDQVRFDMIFDILLPGTKIITPIRDLQLSRETEIRFLEERNIRMNFEKAAYSINKGIWGTSVGGRETLQSRTPLPENAYPTSAEKTGSETIRLSFRQGELFRVNETSYDQPVAALQALQEIAAPYGIGRDIHTGDTIIGIKGRVGFEAAAPLIVIKAHHALEKHTLTKWQLWWKDQLSSWYGNWLHEGQYLDPVMRDIEALLSSTQQNVSGDVFVTLHPYRFLVDGIESPHDLMQAKFGSYGEMNRAWTGEDVKGFTRIFGNPVKIWHQVNENQKEKISS